MIIPLRHRFGINVWREQGGWCLRILCGFPALFVFWRYPDVTMPWTFKTGVQIGWMPSSLQEGQTIPAKSWLRLWEKPQERKS